MRPQQVITEKMLQVMPPAEAVNWLRDRRGALGKSGLLRTTEESEAFEEALLARGDPYIDFGLAQYGVSRSVAKKLYEGGDEGLRCTILANSPDGGCAPYWDGFEVGAPETSTEFAALLSNPLLKDNVFEKFFERTGFFENITDDAFEQALVAAADNSRLATPYDEAWMDGYAEYSYNKVFSAAWNMTLTIPATPRGAATLAHFLAKVLPPTNFDATAALKRWFLPNEGGGLDWGFYLRSRIADLLPADDQLLKSPDKALRLSFYRRFQPSRQKDWVKLLTLDGDDGLSAALSNHNIWRSEEYREALSRACWDFPDPNHRLDLPNFFNAAERDMLAKHPEWFNRR
jgi:hypothetical protein